MNDSLSAFRNFDRVVMPIIETDDVMQPNVGESATHSKTPSNLNFTLLCHGFLRVGGLAKM